METYDSMPAAHETFDDTAADKARSAKNEDIHTATPAIFM
jgi:hypothetical protein